MLGGLIAAFFLYLVKRMIVDQTDMIRAARKYVPYLVSLMVLVFSTYLMLKGFKKIWKVDFTTAVLIGITSAGVVFFTIRPVISRAARKLTNDRESINQLFTMPLIFSAALLSFAHGANDVANAVGPLAAISDALSSGDISTKAAIPLWVMIIGAAGIAVGLALYGPKLIRTVGSEITHLDKARAFCVALAAAITVIVASQAGLPVSSTHIAVGGVFGVGFLREYLMAYRERLSSEIEECIQGDDDQQVSDFLEEFRTTAVADQGALLKKLRQSTSQDLYLAKKDRKDLRIIHRKELVKRSMLYKIGAAWVITVPASGIIAAFIYYAIRGFMLP